MEKLVDLMVQRFGEVCPKATLRARAGQEKGGMAWKIISHLLMAELQSAGTQCLL